MVDNEGEMVVIKRKYGRKWFRWSRMRRDVQERVGDGSDKADVHFNI